MLTQVTNTFPKMVKIGLLLFDTTNQNSTTSLLPLCSSLYWNVLKSCCVLKKMMMIGFKINRNVIVVGRQILIPNEERRNITSMYHKLRVFELEHVTPLIPWERYLSIVLDRNIEDDVELVVYASDYFPQLGALLNKTDSRFNSLLSFSSSSFDFFFINFFFILRVLKLALPSSSRSQNQTMLTQFSALVAAQIWSSPIDLFLS